ncbi:MAG: GNAT family N-acyltransferase [Pseudomonadota bacterium]
MFNHLMYLDRNFYRTFAANEIVDVGMDLQIRSGNLSVRIASSDEIKDVISLRTAVFAREYKRQIIALKSDLDRYDRNARHLIVKDESTNKVVAGYRLIEGQSADEYYSSSEFDLSQLMDFNGKKLELSKAVVHRNYRTGKTLQLLWKGLLKYAEFRRIDFLFGIPSVQTTCQQEANSILDWFRSNGHFSESIAEPHGEFKTSGKLRLNYSDVSEVIPSLLKVYLKSGARIVSGPAIDLKYKCTDYLMVLPLDQLGEKFRNKFQSRSGPLVVNG